MKNTLLFSLLSLFTVTGGYAQTILFQQNFDAGGTLSNYVSATPNVNQFNAISGPSGAIVNGTLQFDRPLGTSTGVLARNADLSPLSTTLYIQMDFEVVSAITVAGSSALVFYLGSGFTNSPANPDVADQYARFGIGFTNTGGQFTVRYIGPGGVGSSNSAPFSGRQTLTFMVNNSGQTITYLQPGGGTQTLANDTFDLWVGNTEVFNGKPALTPTQTMTDFKLRIDDDVYAATFQFDNFLIRDISGALPVTLTRFTGKVHGPQVDLTWETANEQQLSRFSVERSTDAREFATIGTVTAGESAGQRTYGFSDQSPIDGVNYYRLRQIDHNGSSSIVGHVVPVRYQPDQPALLLLGNPAAPDGIVVRTYALTNPVYGLVTLTGQSIDFTVHPGFGGAVLLRPSSPLPTGIYLLSAWSPGQPTVRQRVLVR